MGNLHELAQLLISAWLITGDERRIPTSHGVLDQALKMATDKGLLPSWAQDQLHFTDSRVGLQCVELPSILDWAQMADLTSAPNPSYRYTEVQVSPRIARKFLKDLNVSQDEAQQLGRLLRERTSELMAQQAAVDVMGVDSY
jgi:hypothetical protein